MVADLTIDARLKSVLPPLTSDEKEQLEANIVRAGRVIDPILYWHDPETEKDCIVEGMHRYEIATRLGIPFKREPLVLESIQHAKLWILEHQAGRRHYADRMQARLLRGQLYNESKRPDGGHGHQPPSKKGGDQNEPPLDSESARDTGRAAERIAAKHGGSASGVKRDGKLVASLKQINQRMREKIESGDLRVPDAIVHALATVDHATQMTIWRDVRVHQMTWAEACAHRGAKAPQPVKTNPPKATGKTPTQGKSADRSGDKGQRMDSPAAGFSTPPQPPQLINEARELFHRMTPAQRQQVYVLWGEWLEDSQADQQVVSREETRAEQPEKVESTPKTKKQKRTTFQKPTIEEIQAYCYERNNGISGQDFFDFYEARGWKLTKGVAMVDWKAAVHTWEKNQRLDTSRRRDPRGTRSAAEEFLSSQAN